ncbi:MAG: glutamate--tRNA ligase [Gammaproteobacteria bacterium]|nr:glutamate--tRNA ligase [Gammaproteobacteria bacterium]
MTVRTRIAPSPTGDPHVGTAYIALFNLAFARAHGGQFILRIEDTDRERSTPESEIAILSALRWLGLEWDEGPDIGGPAGPYRQSERGALYASHAHALVESGHAFHCFCTAQTLDQMRAEQQAAGVNPHYDGRCERLAAAEVSQRLAQGEPSVIRLSVPNEGECVLHDRLRGEIRIPWSQVDRQVLLKSDGMPTYHLANVVDDHCMGITHVIRGEEWIPSAPKHQLLYRYFGWEMPELCHLPLLRNPDQSKLSKRKNPTSILFYRDQGYLPEALLNYLGRMGWSMPDERERFTLEDMIAAFTLDRVSLGGPIFDLDKLNWLNGEWLRHGLSDAEVLTRFMHWGFGPSFFESTWPHLKTRITTFGEAEPWLRPLWVTEPEYEAAALHNVGLAPDVLIEGLQFLVWRLDAERQWGREQVMSAVQFVCTALQLKLKDWMPVLFIALSGSTHAMSAFDLAVLLGPDRTRARVRLALERLGGVSKKAQKRLEKAYQVACESGQD